MHVIITVHTLGPQSLNYAKQKSLLDLTCHLLNMILQYSVHVVKISMSKHIVN